MHIDTSSADRSLYEISVTERYLASPNEDSFANLFRTLTPQLISFFRARGCESAVAEDLTQDVMLVVHRKVGQIRDRTLFRAWLFKVARNAMCRLYSKRVREADSVHLDAAADRMLIDEEDPGGRKAFEFEEWMRFLDERERELMRLRFVEEWEYHEIAAAQAIPIGTVQWRVFNAKKKLAPHLAPRKGVTRRCN